MLNVVVALPAEAEPLVDNWALKRADSRGCSLYESADIRLIVSGTGRESAASATAYLAGRCKTSSAGWLNVGIAGSAGYPVGTALLAHKVVDRMSKEIFYPVVSFQPPCATATIHTVAEVERQYAGADAYEMEASGFCAAAARFGIVEQVHVFKVVSDGPAAPPEDLSKDRVRSLVASALPQVDALRAELLGAGRAA